ncbi:hypothetical protein TorRG33x02_169290 [Trema orientale]|uniref:Transmembrane protein n=1 Tax=Trema orientale TaxID=63057 RepID=A0A2P5EP29_TREOI|nr:hypothetical protein TorRG33x02_169290 [Trema orientale]
MTTGADEGSLRSAIHDEPDSVSNEKGPDFSILKGSWTGFEIAHLFFLATRRLLLYIHTKKQTAIENRASAEAEAEPKTRDFLILSLGFLSIGFLFVVLCLWTSSLASGRA